MIYVYILELEKDKFYVGKTSDPDNRINRHFNNDGSVWTKKYKPIKLLELIENCDDYDEDKYTLKYMDIYGIENVRGGSFVTIILEESTIKYIKSISKTNNIKTNEIFETSNDEQLLEYNINVEDEGMDVEENVIINFEDDNSIVDFEENVTTDQNGKNQNCIIVITVLVMIIIFIIILIYK